MGVLYILDEPSIGLHQRDNDKLLATLGRLRDLGNTLIVVEHDEDTMFAADHIVDIGPGAGRNGGEVVFEGTIDELLKSDKSITGQYLSGKKFIPVPEIRRKGNGKSITVKGCAVNNLKHTDFHDSARHADLCHRCFGFGQVLVRQRNPVQKAGSGAERREDSCRRARRIHRHRESG